MVEHQQSILLKNRLVIKHRCRAIAGRFESSITLDFAEDTQVLMQFRPVRFDFDAFEDFDSVLDLNIHNSQLI